jgi:3D (Asp-Asp-Asp) domain-containing protein
MPMRKMIFIIIGIVSIPMLIGNYRHNRQLVEEEKKKKKDYRVVSVTMYTVDPLQTDSSPTETASGFIVDSLNPKKHRIIAISRDLRRILKFGKKVRIEGIGKYNGVYVVRDLMNSRFKNKIDILINPDDKARSFRKAKLYVL